jgi:uncharacterized protein YrzB (UPF0473 family)
MHEHDDNCNCDEELDHDTITLTLEDDTEVVCDVICTFPCNGNDYIALLPQESGEDGEVLLYKYVESENEEFELVLIEDDEEFEAVSEAFDEVLDSAEFEELYEEDEEDEEK